MDLGGGRGSADGNFFFQNLVILHIKLKGMKTRTCKQYFSLGLGQKVKQFFFCKLACSLHYQIVGEKKKIIQAKS